VVPGQRLIELWKDGVFIFIAPGDEDFLGWRMHDFDPKPPTLRLTVGFDNLPRTTGPATLTSTPEGKMRIAGSARNAPGPALKAYQLADLADYDPERVAYLLMADIYNGFGYDSMSVPYINLSDERPRLRASVIVGSDLPGAVPAPDS
jgi:hypothetical protein